MNCEQFRTTLQDSDDGVSCTPVMEVHRRECLACSEMLDDLLWISREAPSLAAANLAEPPSRIWASLQIQLREEGIIQERKPERDARVVPTFGWFRRLAPGFAYAAVFAIALGAAYFYSLYQRVPGPALNPALAVAPIPPPPSPPINDVLQKVPPEQRAIYVSNLNEVDSSIQQLRMYMAAHPEDPFAREDLLSTYQQRTRLWEDMLRWQEFPAEAPVP